MFESAFECIGSWGANICTHRTDYLDFLDLISAEDFTAHDPNVSILGSDPEANPLSPSRLVQDFATK